MLDFRHAWRTLRRSPGFTLVAIACVALGGGLTTTIFAAVNGVLLRPLPLPDDERLVVVHEQNRPKDLHNTRISWADYASWRAESHVFAAMAIWLAGFEQLSGPEGDPERVISARTTGALF